MPSATGMVTVSSAGVVATSCKSLVTVAACGGGITGETGFSVCTGVVVGVVVDVACRI